MWVGPSQNQYVIQGVGELVSGLHFDQSKSEMGAGIRIDSTFWIRRLVSIKLTVETGPPLPFPPLSVEVERID